METNVKKNMDLLGLKVKDKVTGYTGVIDSISFDLYGCTQALVAPVVKDDNKREVACWFDVGRLKILSKKPVMEIPNFDYDKGPSMKPGF